VIRLTLRQFRTQAVVALGALVVLAIALAVTAPHLRHLYNTSGIATCRADGDCGTVTDAFLTHYRLVQRLPSLLLLLPAVTGVFWGAPLVAKEFDAGTYRLAWTQSVTRTRWLGGKVAVVGLASVATSGLLSLLITWWFSPIDKATQSRFGGEAFFERNVTPLGYAAFAFALGVTAGLLIRRTLPAMATTLVGTIAAELAVSSWLRPKFRAPLHFIGPLKPALGATTKAPPTDPTTSPSDWIVSQHFLDPTGHPTNTLRIRADDACLATKSCLSGYQQVVTYQPASRYWAFQWEETAIFVAAAVLLVGFCFWWVRRRA
jgi:hypothetical protein